MNENWGAGGGGAPCCWELPVPELALASYQRALAPKRLVNLAGGHFDAYVADFEAASKAAVEWFTQHLAPE